MNYLQVFNNEQFGQIRTAVENGEIWFVGKDVAKALGYNINSKPVQRHVDNEDRLKQHTLTNGGKQELLFINESGLYSLILSSKLESAKKFKRWVTSEVLPTLRKTGTYQLSPLSTVEHIDLLQKATLEVNSKIDAVQADLNEFKQDLPLLGCDMDRITSAVRKMGVNCLGGKESNAYADKSLRGKVYSDIYEQLKRQFGVTSYKNIKRSELDDALGVIRYYLLPIVLRNEIMQANSQMRLKERK